MSRPVAQTGVGFNAGVLEAGALHQILHFLHFYTASFPEISPPLGNAAEPSRALARYWETPMVGKLAPLPLRLMLRTSQPAGLATYVFSRVEVEKM